MNIALFTYSKDFVEQWKSVLTKVYAYDEYMNFLLVPSFFATSKTLSYLPLLNFTDRLNSQIDDLLELSKDNKFLIRTINPEYKDFKLNDTVTMRVDMSSLDSEHILKNIVHANTRRTIKQGLKRFDIKLVIGKEQNLIDDFFILFEKIMHKHGTPPISKKIFEVMNQELHQFEFYIFYYENVPIAGSIVFIDNELATLFWNCIDYNYSHTRIGYVSFWKIIENISNKYKEVKVLDFGRSSFGGATYKFKSGFGAVPVKIDLHQDSYEDVYTKYAFVSYIWKKLPSSFVNYLGPKLCKHLVDL